MLNAHKHLSCYVRRTSIRVHSAHIAHHHFYQSDEPKVGLELQEQEHSSTK